MFGFSSKKRAMRALADERYADCVTMSRSPVFYRDYTVADTVDGRFDLLILYVSLLVRALRTQNDEGNRLAGFVLEALVSDLDRSVREMGVGDLSVGKKVKTMMEAYQGRMSAYDGALKSDNLDALKQALLRNIYRGNAPHADTLQSLTARVADDARLLMRNAPLLLSLKHKTWEAGAEQ